MNDTDVSAWLPHPDRTRAVVTEPGPDGRIGFATIEHGGRQASPAWLAPLRAGPRSAGRPMTSWSCGAGSAATASWVCCAPTAELGSHKELLLSDGLYADLFTLQADAYRT